MNMSVHKQTNVVPLPLPGLGLGLNPVRFSARTVEELLDLAYSTEDLDFHAEGALTRALPEHRAALDAVFTAFGLAVRAHHAPELVLNTWAVIRVSVCSALSHYSRDQFEVFVRPSRSTEFCAYVLAVAEQNLEAMRTTAEALGIYRGVPAGHALARAIDL